MTDADSVTLFEQLCAAADDESLAVACDLAEQNGWALRSPAFATMSLLRWNGKSAARSARTQPRRWSTLRYGFDGAFAAWSRARVKNDLPRARSWTIVGPRHG